MQAAHPGCSDGQDQQDYQPTSPPTQTVSSCTMPAHRLGMVPLPNLHTHCCLLLLQLVAKAGQLPLRDHSLRREAAVGGCQLRLDLLQPGLSLGKEILHREECSVRNAARGMQREKRSLCNSQDGILDTGDLHASSLQFLLLVLGLS